MSDSMRILSYNTQMRSALMEMGFPPSIPPVYTAPVRAKLVSQAILDSAEEIDVVCLNEIFDEPSRGILSDELSGEFPFQVSKVDTFHTRIVSPGIADDILEKVWELTFGPLTDLAGVARLKLEDSGLFLASRFPFATVPTPPEVVALLGPLAFPNGVPVVRFLMYADSSDADKYAAKGVLYARLKPPGTGVRHVFISHTQADSEAIEENIGDREKQIQTVASFIEHCIEQTPPFSEEVFFLGDLNIVGHGRPGPGGAPARGERSRVDQPVRDTGGPDVRPAGRQVGTRPVPRRRHGTHGPRLHRGRRVLLQPGSGSTTCSPRPRPNSPCSTCVSTASSPTRTGCCPSSATTSRCWPTSTSPRRTAPPPPPSSRPTSSISMTATRCSTGW